MAGLQDICPVLVGSRVIRATAAPRRAAAQAASAPACPPPITTMSKTGIICCFAEQSSLQWKGGGRNRFTLHAGRGGVALESGDRLRVGRDSSRRFVGRLRKRRDESRPTIAKSAIATNKSYMLVEVHYRLCALTPSPGIPGEGGVRVISSVRKSLNARRGSCGLREILYVRKHPHPPRQNPGRREHALPRRAGDTHQPTNHAGTKRTRAVPDSARGGGACSLNSGHTPCDCPGRNISPLSRIWYNNGSGEAAAVTSRRQGVDFLDDCQRPRGASNHRSVI